MLRRLVRLPLLLAVACCASLAHAQELPPGSRSPAAEAAFAAAIEARSADAARLFVAATRALDARDYLAAQRLYNDVNALVPDEPEVLRRLSYVELMLGRTRGARQLAQRALRLDATPGSRTTLAAALLADDGDAREALRLARVGAESRPGDAYAQVVLLGAALALDSGDQRLAALRLEVLAPDWPMTHYYLAIVNWLDAAPPAAARALRRAERLGLAHERVEQALASGLRLDLWIYRLGHLGIAVALAGLVGLIGLAVAARRDATGAVPLPA